jgi:branched-chain amino acid transport system substrate-binding protein
MVPGQHHVRMNMYIAQANNGKFKIVKNLGVIDPQERMVTQPNRREVEV